MNRFKAFYRSSGWNNKVNREIKRIQNAGRITFLQALYKYKNVDYDAKNLLPNRIESDNLFDYLDKLDGKYIILISSCHTSIGHWDEFLERQNLGLRSKIGHRASYCAIIDIQEHKVIEKYGKEVQEIHYCVEPEIHMNVNVGKSEKWHIDIGSSKSYHITVVSQGYHEEDNSVTSNIFINNIDYSLQRRGINIAVFDKNAGICIDSFNVDIHGDATFHINRTI